MNKKHHFGIISLECQSSLINTLDKSQATQLGDQMASELSKVLRLSADVSLVVAAACYPTEAMLTPHFVIHNNLLKYASAVFQGEQQQHRVLAIGAHQGNMPEGLQPPDSGAPLMHVPFVLISEDEAVCHRFEETLLDKGMVSPPTYQLLRDFFQGPIIHANYMTHLDLIAMMHNHYDQVGMHHLWQVIETALLAAEPHFDYNHNHQSFYLRGQTVFMPFVPLHAFRQENPGSTTQGFIQWLLAQRLAAEVFQSHGLKTAFFLSDNPCRHLDDDSIKSNLIKSDFYHHTQPSERRPQQPQLVDYMDPDAGYVWTILTETNGQQLCFYPLNKTGQAAIDAYLETNHGELYHAADKRKQRLDGRLQESSGCH
ncbi:MAG: hypothetical protein DWP95_05030 [Proteobacteria bacterium]|nr:MAG: hypothetical protein DWP95_05030 [Pseudomonadota bacterium]